MKNVAGRGGEEEKTWKGHGGKNPGELLVPPGVVCGSVYKN